MFSFSRYRTCFLNFSCKSMEQDETFSENKGLKSYSDEDKTLKKK